MSRITLEEWREESEQHETETLALAVELGQKIRSRKGRSTFRKLAQSWSTIRCRSKIQQDCSVLKRRCSLMDRALTFDGRIAATCHDCHNRNWRIVATHIIESGFTPQTTRIATHRPSHPLISNLLTISWLTERDGCGVPARRRVFGLGRVVGVEVFIARIVRRNCHAPVACKTRRSADPSAGSVCAPRACRFRIIGLG